MSLPGLVSYFMTEWHPMNWFDDCRYIVVDDVPWDDYKKRNFPVKEDCLTANGDHIVSVYLYSPLVANMIFIM